MVSLSMLLLLFLSLCSTIIIFREVAASRDHHKYGSYENPNLAYSHYWAEAANVVEDLSSFQALYVMYSNCVWSASYGENKDNHHRLQRRIKDNDNDRKCGQQNGGGDGDWYLGMNECYGSNVAYSLFGVLSDDESIGDNPCVKQTFINSFYTTDGLQSFAYASNGAVDDSAVSQTCSSLGYGKSSTLGCSVSGKFVIDAFEGYGCVGAYYNATLDTLDELNAALTDNMQCALIYKNDGSLDYATQLLSYSVACSNEQGSNNKYFCPDPYHMIEAYEYNFVMAQQDGNYTVAAMTSTRARYHHKTEMGIGVLFLVAGCVLLVLAILKWRRSKKVNRVNQSKNGKLVQEPLMEGTYA